ncbi:hypothetical protein EG68_02992 [Paragonimus skrjabini miyazakii]|uniref:Uncharacterized protein n=1 Tax=Paragonimus skrjabini miyazakii TaxID=59628 RepID=A0A8S9YYJ6_9TREM|nr:hypothetical protein EG68_02992 [Paragonimus skrjabini miyazakii]
MLTYVVFFTFAVTLLALPIRLVPSAKPANPEAPHLVSTCIVNFVSSPVIGSLLVDDVDMDGHWDVFFATIDGVLHGILGFADCSAATQCRPPRSRWTAQLRGGHLVSSPISVNPDGGGQNLIMLVSDRGVLFVYNHLGENVAEIQIPSVMVDLSTIDYAHEMPVRIPGRLSERVHWDKDNTTAGSDLPNPPYLLTSPLIISDRIFAQSLSTDFPPVPTRIPLNLLTTTFGGSIYRVSLPLKKETSNVQLLWSASDSSTVLPHSCVLFDCPILHGLSEPVSLRPQLCCLLLDATSTLRLINVDSVFIQRSIFSGRLLWEYYPFQSGPSESPKPALQQLGQVTLVPGSCSEPISKHNCSLWAVYPTPDGYAFLMLIHPLTSFAFIQFIFSNVSSACQLFSDTRGYFYHLRLHAPPLVLMDTNTIIDAQCSERDFSNSDEIRTWLSPTPFVYKRMWFPNRHVSHRNGLGLLVAYDSGIVFLRSTMAGLHSVEFVHDNTTPSKHDLFEYSLFDASFLDKSDKSTAVVHMDPGQRYLRYRLRNCPWLKDSSSRINYIVQLLDSVGIPISDWSTPNPLQVNEFTLSNHTDCHGKLVITRPLYDQFYGRVHLLVVQPHTGRVLSAPDFNLGRPGIASSVLLDFHSSWPELLVVWTYLSLSFFLISLGLLCFVPSDMRASLTQKV